MKHTELPWHVSLGNNNYVWAKDCIIAKCNPEQAEMYREKSIKEDEANAAFIVKACNEREGLINLLKEMSEYLNHGHGTSIGCESIFHQQMREAIKEAE